METKQVQTKFKKGQEVWILNSLMSGQFIVEGKAKIVSHIEDDLYAVQFRNDMSKPKTTFERFVDVAAQDDPQGFVDALNEAEHDSKINNDEAEHYAAMGAA